MANPDESPDDGKRRRLLQDSDRKALVAVGTKRRLPLLLTGVLFCGAGILRIWQSGGGSSDGYLLAGAALVIIGAWLTMEIQAEVRKLHFEHSEQYEQQLRDDFADLEAEDEEEGEE